MEASKDVKLIKDNKMPNYLYSLLCSCFRGVDGTPDSFSANSYRSRPRSATTAIDMSLTELSTNAFQLRDTSCRTFMSASNLPDIGRSNHSHVTADNVRSRSTPVSCRSFSEMNRTRRPYALDCDSARFNAPVPDSVLSAESSAVNRSIRRRHN